MCVSCTEYIKNRLTTAELKSAIKEAAREDSQHQAQVERLIAEKGSDREELKKALQPLNTTPRDY